MLNTLGAQLSTRLPLANHQLYAVEAHMVEAFAANTKFDSEMNLEDATNRTPLSSQI